MGNLSDQTAGFGESAETGLTRRDLLAKSVVAGGLVWAAPTLLSSPAAAADSCFCGGTKTTVKISSTPSDNCGTSCISWRGRFNYPCLSDLSSCLREKGYINFDTAYFTNGGNRRAKIVLTGGITPIEVGVNTTNDCYFASCDNNYCPNGTSSSQGGDNYQTVVTYNPPAGTVPVIRVLGMPGTVCTGTEAVAPGEVHIYIDTNQIRQPLNHMEMSLCIPSELTALC